MIQNPQGFLPDNLSPEEIYKMPGFVSLLLIHQLILIKPGVRS